MEKEFNPYMVMLDEGRMVLRKIATEEITLKIDQRIERRDVGPRTAGSGSGRFA